MKAYLVGGAVRDTLLGLEPKERDFVVIGSSIDEMLKANFIKIGKTFPVFLHPHTKEEYALARTEKKTGKRREGTYSGFFVVFMKTSVTLALAMSNWVLGAAGFEAPEASCGLEAGDLSDTQPGEVKRVIRILCGPLPAALFVLATFFVWLFPITRESHAEVAKEMKAIRRKRSSMRASKLAGDIELNQVVEKKDVSLSEKDIVAK